MALTQFKDIIDQLKSGRTKIIRMASSYVSSTFPQKRTSPTIREKSTDQGYSDSKVPTAKQTVLGLTSSSSHELSSNAEDPNGDLLLQIGDFRHANGI